MDWEKGRRGSEREDEEEEKDRLSESWLCLNRHIFSGHVVLTTERDCNLLKIFCHRLMMNFSFLRAYHLGIKEAGEKKSEVREESSVRDLCDCESERREQNERIGSRSEEKGRWVPRHRYKWLT